MNHTLHRSRAHPALRHQAPGRLRSALSATRYLPTLLFISFFLGNTLIPPRRLWLMGRWGALLAIVGLTLITARPRHVSRWPPVSFLLTLAFFNLILLLPFSVNVVISTAKWGVFGLFLLFCGLYFGRVNNREELRQVLGPLIGFFVVFIWASVPADLFFQSRNSLGNMKGMLTFTGSLGAFLAVFGIPAVLYKIETTRDNRRRLMYGATLAVALYLVAASGSRISALGAILVLGLALIRWKGLNSRSATAGKVLLILFALLMVPGQQQRIKAFIYKYPGSTTLEDARGSYWRATKSAFRARPWTGSGLGVQAQQQEVKSRLSFVSTGRFREQGSSYLGMLEELGILGATPLFGVFLLIAFKNGWFLLRSKDPLHLFFARSVACGLLWGVAGNYLLYLGGAFSILLFYSIFLQERLTQLERHERVALRRREQAAYWRRVKSGGLGALGPAPAFFAAVTPAYRKTSR